MSKWALWILRWQSNNWWICSSHLNPFSIDFYFWIVFCLVVVIKLLWSHWRFPNRSRKNWFSRIDNKNYSRIKNHWFQNWCVNLVGKNLYFKWNQDAFMFEVYWILVRFQKCTVKDVNTQYKDVNASKEKQKFYNALKFSRLITVKWLTSTLKVSITNFWIRLMSKAK